jgi:hypothetical protein
MLSSEVRLFISFVSFLIAIVLFIVNIEDEEG